MKNNLLFFIYGKYPKMWYIFKKILVLSKGENEVEKMFKEESVGISGCNYFKNMVVEKISQWFRYENIEKTRNYFVEEIKQNELLCFCFFSWHSYRDSSSLILLKICSTTEETKRYKSIIKKKQRKHYEIVLPAKIKLNSIEVLVSRTSVATGIDTSEFAKNTDLANLS